MQQDPAGDPYDTREVQDVLRLIEAESISSHDITKRASEQGQAVNSRPKFIPSGRIERYFVQPENNFRTVNELLKVIFGPNQYNVSPKDLAENCSRVFCILILLGRPKLIGHFVDEESLWDNNLPFTGDSPPYRFPSDPNHTDLFTKFKEEQWRFCALKLQGRSTVNVHKHRVLPFTDSENIGGGGTAFVHRVEIHPNHDGLTPSAPSSHVYVIKTFKRTNAGPNFDREVAAFKQVTDAGNRSAPGLIEFYGGFRYRGTFNIVLQYADSGTLEELFRQNQPPNSGEEIISFWSNLFEIIKGICQIHEQHLHPEKAPGKITGILRQGWHQDVKPKNILVLNNGNMSTSSASLSSPTFPKSFKIADLGQCHFKTILAGGLELEDHDTFGTQTYGAPECYQMTAFSEHRANLIKRNVDIWSLGCVFSEAYVWVTKGWQGLVAFREARKQATDLIDARSDLPLGDCFHNGFSRLEVVDTWLEGIKADFRSGDCASGRVLEHMIYGPLQQDPGSRPSARVMQANALILLNGARKELERQSMITPPTPASAQDQRASLSTQPSPPPISSPTQPPHPRDSAAFIEHPPVWNIGRENNIYSSPQASQINHITPSGNLMQSALPRNSSSATARQRLPVHASVSDPNSTHDPQSPPEASRDLNSGVRPIAPIGSTNHPASSGTGNDHFQIPPTPSGPENGLGLCSEPSGVPYWSVTDAKAWRARQKDQSASLTKKATKFFSPKKREDEKKAALPHGRYMGELSGRDHVFFIDDSFSMINLWNDVSVVAELLVYITKTMDPDGVELFFLSANERHNTFTDSTVFSNAIRKHVPQASTNLNQCFDNYIRNYGKEIEKHSKMYNQQGLTKRSIYVLTDGVFDSGLEDEGHDAIKSLVDKLMGAHLPRGQIGIQFISFGTNEAGLARLQRLDRLKTELNLKLDVVDTEHATKNVCKMLLGAINAKFDND